MIYINVSLFGTWISMGDANTQPSQPSIYCLPHLDTITNSIKRLTLASTSKYRPSSNIGKAPLQTATDLTAQRKGKKNSSTVGCPWHPALDIHNSA